jgi:GH43 family beta-xylosidase
MSARPVPTRLASLVAVLAVVLSGLLLPMRAWAAPAALAAPTLTTADGQSLTATWTGSSDTAVTGYVVRVLDVQGAQVAVRLVAASVTSQTFSGLDKGAYTATVTALSADGAGAASPASGAQNVTVDLLARWTLGGLASTADGAKVPDSSGNGKDATIVGGGARSATAPGGDALDLPGGNGAYVKLPTGLVDGRATLTVSSWLRNDTGSGNYAALFFGASANPPGRYFLLNPKNPSGLYKSVLTTGNVSGAPWATETGLSPTDPARGVAGPVTDNSWALYTTVITPTSITGYLNGAKVGTVAHSTSMATFGSNLVGYIGHSSYPDANYKGGVRDVRVYTTALSDASVKALYDDDAVQRDRAALSLPSTATTDLTLPTSGANGSQISWASSDPSIISTSGVVKRSTKGDVTVTLTATVAGTGKQTTRAFQVTVPRDSAQDDVDRVSGAFDLAISKVAADLTLRTTIDGVSVSWASSEPSVIAADGRVTRAATERSVRLTATFSRGAAEAVVRSFDVTVLAADAGRVGTYAATGGTNRTDAVHLALSTQPDEGGTYTALNNGRPVLYGPTYDVRLGSPTVFRRPDGSFGLLAVAGGSSGSANAWVWSSSDLVHFSAPRRIDLGRSTTAVRVAYDNGIAAFRLVFASGGSTYEVTTADFSTLSAPAASTATAPAPSTGTFPAGATGQNSAGVTAAELAVVQRAFSRMVNTGTRPVAQVSVGQGSVVDLPRSVTATYSNGGADSQVPVTWDADDVAAIDTSKPGTWTVRGTARPTSYPATVGYQRADPDVTLADDGYYYLVGSYPQVGNDPEGYDRVNLRRARTIAGLASAPETTIWDEQNSALQRYVWAPELTRIGDTWYVLFTASRSGNVFDIRPMMLRHTGGSLIDPANWVEVGAMLPKAGDRAFNAFSLDMTHFEHGGRDYVIWAQAAPSSALLMAEIDPADPRQLISDAVTIAYPDLAWEGNLATNQQIDEGPAVIERDGKIYVTFSASTVDDKYSVGLLTADVGANLLDAASWRKTPYPIMTTADLPAGQTGPGHNSFTTDDLGNTVIVYHSRDTASTTDGGLSDPSRWARARTVHFAADGSPVLTMTADEELRPENAAVSVQVVVSSDPATVPVAPGKPVVSEVTDTSAEVTWSASTGAAGYRVTVRNGSDTVSTATVSATSTTLTGLPAGATLTVSVEATNANGTGPAATSAAFTTTKLPAPVRDFPLLSDLTDRAGGPAATGVGDVTFGADGLTLPGGSSSATNYVKLPDGLVTGLGEDLTISMWVKSDTPARNGAAVAVTTPSQTNGFPVSYWLLNPAGPNGNARSVITSGTPDPGAPYTKEVQVAGPTTTKRNGTWVQYTTVFTAGTLTSYVDGLQIGSVAKTRGFADFAKDGALEAYLGRSGYAQDPTFKGSFRNLQVFGSALSPAQVRVLGSAEQLALDDALAALTLGDTSAVTSDLTLPTKVGDGVGVTWATSDAQVVSAAGVVTVGDTAGTAQLTATLTRGTRSATKVFTVTVPASADRVAVDAAREALTLGDTSAVTSDLTLPTAVGDGVGVTWATSDAQVVSATGVVTVGGTARTAQLTATLTRGTRSATKVFTVTVPASADRVAIDAAREALTLGDTSAVTSDLTLPTKVGDGVGVTWATSNAQVVSAAGAVTVGDTVRTVQLTATLTRGTRSATKVFTVTVPARPVVTPPVDTTPTPTQPDTATTPPVTTTPTTPTTPTTNPTPTTPVVTAPTVTVKGRAVAGRPVRLVISAPGQTSVTVIAAGRKRTVQVRDGVAKIKLRWATPGKKKVVVKTSTGKVVTVVRVRR